MYEFKIWFQRRAKFVVMSKNLEFKRNYFPKYSPFQKAINYPYNSPKGPFTFKKGKLFKGVHLSLKSRVPIISVGSNRSPYQLKNKFGLKEDLCAIPVILHDSDIVYAASISSYGSIPATQWPVNGVSSKLNLLWLNEKQLKIMHLSEGLGVAYDFVELDRQTVKIKNLNYNGPVFAYISSRGAFGFDINAPIRLEKIISFNSHFFSLDEKKALKKLINIELENKVSIKKWVKKLISDKKFRFKIIEQMSKRSIFPKKPTWKVQNINVIGKKIY